MTQDFFLGQLRLIAVALVAYFTGTGKLSAQDGTLIGAVGAPVLLLLGPWAWSIYSNINRKLVPHDATVIPAKAVVMGFAVLLALALGSPRAIAADLSTKAPALTASAPCSPGACSGWYAGFGAMGNGTNADIVGNGINGSVFAAGGALTVDGGYQFWSGSWFAAIEGSAGYEFTTNSTPGLPVSGNAGSKFVGTELIKLGYNFFPSAQSALTTPSQSPVALTVPANLLASTTPYFAFGGLQRLGKNVWVNGAGLETVIASGWTMNAEYLYAPADQGLNATSIIRVGLNKHF